VLRQVLTANVALALLAACAPHARLECRFQLPPHAGKGHDPSHLHVRARAACGGSTEVTPPPPGLEDQDASPEPKGGTEGAILVQRDGWETAVAIHATSCVVAMTAWFDLNENGKVDDGEYVGVLPSHQLRDRGCSGDVTVAPPVTLAERHP